MAKHTQPRRAELEVAEVPGEYDQAAPLGHKRVELRLVLNGPAGAELRVGDTAAAEEVQIIECHGLKYSARRGMQSVWMLAQRGDMAQVALCPPPSRAGQRPDQRASGERQRPRDRHGGAREQGGGEAKEPVSSHARRLAALPAPRARRTAWRPRLRWPRPRLLRCALARTAGTSPIGQGARGCGPR